MGDKKDRRKALLAQSVFKALQVAALIVVSYSVYFVLFAPVHHGPANGPKFVPNVNVFQGNSLVSNPNVSEGPPPPIQAEDPNPNVLPPDHFLPGSLDLTRAESMKKCWVDPKGMYRTHFGDGLCVVSESPNKFIFYHVRKSGSSTGRHVAENYFGGKDHQKCGPNRRYSGDKGYYSVAFVRNPITRFFASYEEMFVRTLGQKRVPKQFDVFHSDLTKYDQYQDMFCGTDSKKPKVGGKKPCDQIPSQDNGELAHRFEKFVEAWDGEIFEIHLAMQAPILSSREGMPIHLDFIGDTKHTAEHWKQIGEELNVSNVTVIRGRGYPRRMNISYIGTKTYNKICQLAAIDFCCLNFKLPPECATSGVACGWETKDGERRIVPKLLVE